MHVKLGVEGQHKLVLVMFIVTDKCHLKLKRITWSMIYMVVFSVIKSMGNMMDLI